ncbi:MAG: sialate O-acetylesterase [Chitinophagaceae bacterium]|nr:sialate O-acetylesterase [Chitinophagaceae bacterium]
MSRILLISILTFVGLVAGAQVRLPKLISDGMVLQRDTELRIWGWASNGEKVAIKFNGRNLKTTTGNDGKWSIRFPSMKAGGPYAMEIVAKNRLLLNNIMIGDVWFCSGQSNMVHTLELHKERYASDIAAADYPDIRHFTVPATGVLQEPQEDITGGKWLIANPRDVLQFSVVGYFFAKDIYEKYKVPIGLINASVGGTPIEAWISENGLKDFASYARTIQRNRDTAYVNELSRRAASVKPRPEQDKGITGLIPWFDPTYMPIGWRSINIPGYWEDQGIRDLDGIVWYRKEIDIPASMTEDTVKVYLGRIVDADVVYINGVRIANTTYQYPQRRYIAPAGLLKPGKNIITVRVTNYSGKGGFVPDKPYRLSSKSKVIDLKGEWQYKVGDVFPPCTPSGRAALSIQNQPAALYNGMTSPLINFPIKGFLWYQGESNTSRAEEYARLLPALISDWRWQWKIPAAPFLYVQLPNFMEANYLPSESQWAELRESQLKTLSVPNTGMVVAIDLGEWNDIHPGNKKDIGLRLALAARRIAYGDSHIVYSGPIFRTIALQGNKLVVEFDHVGSGLVTNDGEDPRQFAIAGSDGKFTWAKTRIEGSKVILWTEEIPEPKFVRYAWADNPDGVNLYNKEGLPASPFRANIESQK